MDLKDIEKRFGVVAVEMGFVKKEDISEALEIQFKENITSGVHRKIGTILEDKGLMTLEQVNEVLRHMLLKPLNPPDEIE